MLGANGLLPTGLVKVTAEQVHQHFVVPFTASSTRQGLYDQWLLHRQAIEAIIPIERQWLDGSRPVTRRSGQAFAGARSGQAVLSGGVGRVAPSSR